MVAVTETAARKPRKKREPGSMKPCRNCGTEFYCMASRQGGGPNIRSYCSAACGHAYRKRPDVVAERFWSRVDRSLPDGCWPYLGSITSKHGYGCTAFNGRVLGAHKVAWMLTNGPVPDGLCVLHKCDNRVCCNPGHHFIGTKKDNSDDKFRKGRGHINMPSKLQPSEVLEIRRLREVEKLPYVRIVEKYPHVSVTAVRAAAIGKSWRHI